MNIIFAAASSFSEQTLLTLAQLEHKIVAVLTQPDRRLGRGMKRTENPIKITAQNLGLPVLEYESLHDLEAYRKIKKLTPDLLLTMAYGQLVPNKILQIPNYDSINIHPSLLPRWRGASPIQSAILNGDKKTGVCLTRMVNELDSGPIFVSREINIGSDETSGLLSNKLAELSATLIKTSLDDILDKKISPTEQVHENATYAPKIKKTDAMINWSLSAIKLLRQIKAYNPWPVSYSLFKGKHFRIWDAELKKRDNCNHPPGKIVEIRDKDILVSTGQQMLALTQVQLEGKKKTTTPEFARGYNCQGLTLGC